MNLKKDVNLHPFNRPIGWESCKLEEVRKILKSAEISIMGEIMIGKFPHLFLF